MQGIQQLIAYGRQSAHGASRFGAGLLQRALDRVYGPPQLARLTRRLFAGTSERQQLSSAPEMEHADTESADTVPAPVIPGAAPPLPLAVAERIRTAKLIGPHDILYGLMWLYLYPAEGVARRVFKVTDKHLGKALKQQYFKFSDVPFDPVAGCKPLFEAMHAECKKVLNGRGGAVRVKRLSQTKSESHKAPVRETVFNKAATERTDEPPAAAVPAPVPIPAPATLSGVPAVQGEAYQGVVISAGRTNRTGPDGASYNTFCMTLNDGVREVPLFGTELERLSIDQRIGPGDRVRVVFMGKVLTQVPGKNRPAFRNLYQLARMEQS